MLEINTKYNNHNSVLLPFWGHRDFRDLIEEQKMNVTFGGGGRHFRNSTPGIHV